MATETQNIDYSTAFDVASDTTPEGQVQMIKLAVSADGDSDPLDMDGLLTAIMAIAATIVAGELKVSDESTDALAALIDTGRLKVTELNSADIKAALEDLVSGGIVIDGGTVTVDGAITEYTEDASAPGNPQGPTLMIRRKDTLASMVTTDDDWIGVLGTAKGELYVKHVDAVEALAKPDATASYASSEVHSTALETGHIIKGSPGVLHSVSGYNNKATGQFIQIHNTTTVPSDTATPIIVFWVDGYSNFAVSFGRFGQYFSTGISICNSSTLATKTVGSADCWFNAQYT